MSHLLIIPDGSRRHAKREFLCDQLRSRREAGTERPLVGDVALPDALRSRLERYMSSGRDPGPHKPADLLDRIDVPPGPFLEASYRRGANVLDSMLRRLLEDRKLRTLSVFGMQIKNLERSDREVNAFMQAECELATRWTSDPLIRSRCSFAIIGDEARLEAERSRRGVARTVESYIDATRELVEAGTGSDLRVNLLAPYDHRWELDRASRDGQFAATRLAVPEDVDLVFRSGCVGRSATSGALPVQTAFSIYALSPKYFPDCGVDDLADALAQVSDENRESGL